MSVDKLISDYAQQCDLGEKTAALHIKTLTTFLRFAGKSCSDVASEDVHRWVDQHSKLVASSTMALRVGMLRKFFDWLYRDPVKNPCLSVSVQRKRKDEPPDVDESIGETLLAVFKGRTPLEIRDEAIVRVLLETGKRAGRMIDLLLSDVAGMGLSKPSLAVIEKYLVVFETWRGLTGSKRLFISANGGSLTRQCIWKIVSSASDAAGLKNVSPEQIRRIRIKKAMSAGAKRSDALVAIGEIPRRRAKATRESEIQYNIRLALGKIEGLALFRNNVGQAREMTPEGKERIVNYGLEEGSADLVGCLKGRWFSLEVKSDSGALSPKQRAWGDLIEKCGGFYAVVRSEAEALEAVKQCLTRRKRDAA